MSDLCFMSIDAVAPRLKSGELSPVELTRAFLERIHAQDGKLTLEWRILTRECLFYLLACLALLYCCAAIPAELSKII